MFQPVIGKFHCNVDRLDVDFNSVFYLASVSASHDNRHGHTHLAAALKNQAIALAQAGFA
jgi:hypothetical protein